MQSYFRSKIIPNIIVIHKGCYINFELNPAIIFEVVKRLYICQCVNYI